MKKSKKNVFLFSVLFISLVLPLLNLILFRGFGMFFESEPLRFPDGRLAAVFLFVYEFLVVVLSFLPPMCIAYSKLAKRSAVQTFAICTFSVLVIYSVMIFENVFINAQAISRMNFAEAGLGWVSVVVCYILVFLAVMFTDSKSKNAPREIELFSLRGLFSRGAVTAMAVTVLFSTAQRAVETYLTVKRLGAPENISHILELATPYVVIAVGGFIAYIAGCAAITRWEGLHTAPKRRK